MQVIYSGVYIRLLEEDRHWLDAAAPGEQELELLFHRVNNAFVYRLRLSFCREVLPLPYYLRANADDLQCRLGTLQIAATAVRVDYALVDFLGVKLQPRTYDMYTYTGVSCADEYVTLFAHDALRGSVKHLVYSVSKNE